MSSPLPPHAFICLSIFSPFIPYLYCLSLSCHAFIPPLLSSLSHLIPLSAHPFIHFPLFVSLVILLTACHWQFCLNSVRNVTFKNQQGTVSAVKLPWVSKLKWKVNVQWEQRISNICTKSVHCSLLQQSKVLSIRLRWTVCYILLVRGLLLCHNPVLFASPRNRLLLFQPVFFEWGHLYWRNIRFCIFVLGCLLRSGSVLTTCLQLSCELCFSCVLWLWVATFLTFRCA